MLQKLVETLFEAFHQLFIRLVYDQVPNLLERNYLSVDKINEPSQSRDDDLAAFFNLVSLVVDTVLGVLVLVRIIYSVVSR